MHIWPIFLRCDRRIFRLGFVLLPSTLLAVVVHMLPHANDPLFFLLFGGLLLLPRYAWPQTSASADSRTRPECRIPPFFPIVLYHTKNKMRRRFNTSLNPPASSTPF